MILYHTPHSDAAKGDRTFKTGDLLHVSSPGEHGCAPKSVYRAQLTILHTPDCTRRVAHAVSHIPVTTMRKLDTSVPGITPRTTGAARDAVTCYGDLSRRLTTETCSGDSLRGLDMETHCG